MKTIEEMASEYADCVACDLPNEHYQDEVKYKAFLAGAQSVQAWISVEDELPPKSENVIFKICGQPVIGRGDAVNEIKEITHWRPIERR